MICEDLAKYKNFISKKNLFLQTFYILKLFIFFFQMKIDT